MTGARAPVADRLARRSVRVGKCLVWTGAVTNSYGRISAGGRSLWVHRVAYEISVGPIPEGWQIDHLCRNRLCILPAHLEAVPQQVNLARGFGPWAVNARKTHCLRGHQLAGDNLRVNSKGERHCRSCQRIRRNAWRARQKLTSAPAAVA